MTTTEWKGIAKPASFSQRLSQCYADLDIEINSHIEKSASKTTADVLIAIEKAGRGLVRSSKQQAVPSAPKSSHKAAALGLSKQMYDLGIDPDHIFMSR